MNEPEATTDLPPEEKLMLVPDGDQGRAVDLSADAIRQLAEQAKIKPEFLMKRLIAGLPHPRGRHIPPTLLELLTDRDREAIRAADEARARKLARRKARRG